MGIIDSDITFITPNQVLLRHLNGTRGWTGIAVRSVMTSHLLDKFTTKRGIEVAETSIKYCRYESSKSSKKYNRQRT